MPPREPAAKTVTTAAASSFDPRTILADFPQLQQRVHGKPLVYLDNAATTQKPRAVLDAGERYYTEECSNVHRGLHQLSVAATEDYERARETARRFINARDTSEIIFVSGTTEAINLVAHSFGALRVGRGDEIVVTTMEHHSNIVPWQMLCERNGAVLRVAPIDDEGNLRLDEYEKLLGPRTRLVAAVHVSNVLGTRNPAARMVEIARARKIPVLFDGAQAAPHETIDVQELDCDFYAFSSHKMYGPTGVGVLYGKAELLASLPPYQGGGDMIRTVSFEGTTYNEIPYRFEAGTPNIAGVIGFGAAIEYVQRIGIEAIAEHERKLLARTAEALSAIPRVRLIGTAPGKAPVVAFVIDGIHPHDIGTVLDHEGIAIRAGHHCCQPLMQRFDVPATARASLGLYNTIEDVERLTRGIHKVLEVFG